MRAPETRLLQDLVLVAASAAFSYLLLSAGLKHLDPNRAASKKALQHKKEISKRLGRPFIDTNPYEVNKKKKKNQSLSVCFQCIFVSRVFFFFSPNLSIEEISQSSRV